MQTILVPTDFSEPAENALYYAIELAKIEKAKILLLHSYTIESAGLVSLHDREADAKRHSDSLLKTAALKVRHAGNIEYEFMSLEGPAVKIILETADKRNVDLIIMGTHNESDLIRAILGSSAVKVMEKASCPVIIVPENAPFNDIKRITFATDYRTSDLQALNKLIEIARPYNAQINILHVSEVTVPVDEEKNMMEEFMQEVTDTVEYNNFSFQMLAGINVEAELEAYLDQNPADLFSMSTHHRDFLDKIFGSSLTRKIAYHPKMPILVFHYNKDSAIKLI
jgi:nucleotide-binding universal stress UspA family protein